MSKPPTLTVKKLVALTPEMAEAIENFRFEKRIASESEATRRLIDLGLKAGMAPGSQTSNQVPVPSPGLAPLLPTIIARYSHPDSGNSPEDVPEIVAEVVLKLLAALHFHFDDIDEDLGSTDHAIVSSVGDREYVRRALQWRNATRRWKEKRGKAKGEAPAAPKLPD